VGFCGSTALSLMLSAKEIKTTDFASWFEKMMKNYDDNLATGLKYEKKP
jgi:hypothetical protein